MINILQSRTTQRSASVAEGKSVWMLAKIKLPMARLLPTKRQARAEELLRAERRRQDLIALRQRLRSELRYRLKVKISD